MDQFITLIPVVGGAYMIAQTFLVSTNNLKSAVIFQILPFFIGLGLLFAGAKLLGVI
jgi:hypothetical protein